MWTTNALRQFHVTYCIVKACIAELNLSSKLKNHDIPRTYVYTNSFLCFSDNSSLLKPAQAFSINPAYLSTSRYRKLAWGMRQN